MPINPFANAGKKTVREQWNTPLLRHLNQLYGIRYRYLGLPGVEVLDLGLWQDMIDEIVAFETRAEPTKRDPYGRRNILELRRRLQLLGKPSIAYFGPMEEVIIRRKDSDGAVYKQEQIVTLYNLDFCDEISSPIETLEAEHQVWRFEAIRRILLDQALCYQQAQQPRYFVLLLTVRNQMDVNKLKGYFSSPLAESRAHWRYCNDISPLPPRGPLIGTHTWALKTFIYDQMRQWFGSPNISSLFFPVVKYDGTPVRVGKQELLQSPMLHMMILCRFGEIQSPTPTAIPRQFLKNTASVRAHDDGALAWDPEPGEPSSMAGAPDPAKWFDRHAVPWMRDPSTGMAVPFP